MEQHPEAQVARELKPAEGAPGPLVLHVVNPRDAKPVCFGLRFAELRQRVDAFLQVGADGLADLAFVAEEGLEGARQAAVPVREVVAQLAAQKIIVTKKPQGIRVATHFFNNENDIERLIEGLNFGVR